MCHRMRKESFLIAVVTRKEIDCCPYGSSDPLHLWQKLEKGFASHFSSHDAVDCSEIDSCDVIFTSFPMALAVSLTTFPSFGAFAVSFRPFAESFTPFASFPFFRLRWRLRERARERCDPRRLLAAPFFDVAPPPPPPPPPTATTAASAEASVAGDKSIDESMPVPDELTSGERRRVRGEPGVVLIEMSG